MKIAEDSNSTDLMQAMLAFAREQADIWSHLDRDEIMERIEAHLESAFPGVSGEAIAAVVNRAANTD